ncbi:MAG: hypothetical protein U5L03_16345 [Burkholderiaceae bacterium]|nr:hypothetical protein [Burkholderiaceae bacterium]
MGTLLAREYAALSEVAPTEASFLGVLLPDLLRTAAKSGSSHLAFHEYDLRARSEPLGAILTAVTWEIRRHGLKIASDTAIQYKP